MPNWDDLNFFRVIASERSFRRAAARLKLSINTIRGRVDRLEKALEMTLLVRGRDGLSLTDEGMTALGIVLEMDATSRRLAPRACPDSTLAGETLTICCTEGIGEFWLAPRLPSLLRLINANMTFLCYSDQDRIHSAERDICIGFARPTNPETIVCKLATFHFTLCASKAYLERCGHPRSMDDLDDHCFILHESYGLNDEAMRRLVGEHRARRLVAAKMNGSHALFQAIASGLGIGALPTYLLKLSDDIEPLDLPMLLSSDLWLSFNRSGMTSQTNRDAIDWIKGCFRQMDHPWFGGEFIQHRDVRPDWIDRPAIPLEGAAANPLVPATGIDFPA